MKTLMLSIVLVLVQWNAARIFGIGDGGNDKTMPSESAWVKSETGVWLGNYHIWYKMDKKNSVVKFSRNGKKWKEATDVAWQDNHGRWLYIYQDKLVYSTDAKHWEELKDRTWQDVDGNWYRFDGNWELWVAK